MDFEPWQAWLGLGALLAIAEVLGTELILLMLAVGAMAGMVAALAGLGVELQVISAALVSVAMLALVRPSVLKRLHQGPELRHGHTRLVGSRALVTEEITATAPGRVKLDGEIWSAAPYDEHLTIAPGETVEVFEIRGATAYVHPVPRLES
ncbi:NfeD family protein [Nocardioides sp. CFH 31398]|uniref:NfeD family protein n=1 Tax=Nocardioides sp. CFH 31398 TaxID=2919579 RepID=UPI001F062CE4|nr:NfeD family protein [Nocardioides sp. CFH 31398]MCH1866787.1 NfeD family protein [Nocardioides sp. CFH 31398]